MQARSREVYRHDYYTIEGNICLAQACMAFTMLRTQELSEPVGCTLPWHLQGQHACSQQALFDMQLWQGAQSLFLSSMQLPGNLHI